MFATAGTMDPQVGRFINSDVYMSTGQGFGGFNMFAYCQNNPVMYVDYYGEDAIYVVDYTVDIGLPVVGHAILYYQDKHGDWYKTEFAGSKPKNAKIRNKKVSTNQIPFKSTKNLRSIYITGDFSKCYTYANKYKGTNYGGYNLFTNNCLDYVQDVLKKGVASQAMVERYIEQTDKMVPNNYGNGLSNAIWKSNLPPVVKSVYSQKIKYVTK